MLNSTVPTPTTLLLLASSAGGLAVASMMKTSWSGSVNGMFAVQLRAMTSSQRLLPVFHLRIRLVGGAFGVEPGGGGGMPLGLELFDTTPSTIDVVRLPDWKAAA